MNNASEKPYRPGSSAQTASCRGAAWAAARGNARSGYALVGLLIVVAIIIVLFTIVNTSINYAVTGEGAARPHTLRSAEDRMNLYALYQGFAAFATSNNSRMPLPSEISRTLDRSLDTTANFYSALVAQNLIKPQQLISANEDSSFVHAMRDYNYNAYNPSAGVYWDERFKADLHNESHVSFAHVPFYGDRFDRFWRFDHRRTIPFIGNRGPENGIPNPQSFSYGRAGVWGGHLLFGDGEIAFTDTFTPPGLVFERHGRQYDDNIFAFDDGIGGIDAILTFTREMSPQGPVVQWD